MSQIIKQPNGKYCIFSGIVDNVTYYDMTEEEIVETWVEEQRVEITKKVKETIEKLEKGGKPYYQFTQSYEEMVSWIEEIHGKAEAEKVREEIETE